MDMLPPCSRLCAWTLSLVAVRLTLCPFWWILLWVCEFPALLFCASRCIHMYIVLREVVVPFKSLQLKTPQQPSDEVMLPLLPVVFPTWSCLRWNQEPKRPKGPKVIHMTFKWGCDDLSDKELAVKLLGPETAMACHGSHPTWAKNMQKRMLKQHEVFRWETGWTGSIPSWRFGYAAEFASGNLQAKLA